MKNRTEDKTYVIYTEVRGRHGSPTADMCVSMAEVTPGGDIDLNHPEQCESLAAYLVFDRIVKAFEPGASTAVDTVSEMLALSSLEAMVQDSEIVFPESPAAGWMKEVLNSHPRLTDKALRLVKAALKEGSKASLYTELADYIYSKMKPKDYAKLAESALKEMTRRFPAHGPCVKRETGRGGGKRQPSVHNPGKKKEETDG